MNSKKMLTCLALALSVHSAWVWATGPRIKQDLFTPNANPIYALDFPPFITTELNGGGVAIELVNAILQQEKIDASISILPLPRMMKYYIFQEKALALVANRLSFTPDEQESLVFIPLLRFKKYYYVYQPKHPEGLPWTGDLKALANLIYGANPEENVADYKEVGIRVETGTTISLLEKLKGGKIDFLGSSELTVNWLLDKNFSLDKVKFSKQEPSGGEETVFIVFSKNHPQGDILAKQFKDGLTSMVANGRYKALLEKHLGGSEAVDRYILPLQ